MAVILIIIACVLLVGFAFSRLRARKNAKEDVLTLFP
jgi:hypothetical protein